MSANRTRTIVDTAVELAESLSCSLDTALELAVEETTRRHGVPAPTSVSLATKLLPAAMRRRGLVAEVAALADRSENMRRQLELIAAT